MCDVCGCGDPEVISVELHEKILGSNDRMAEHNRRHFRSRGVFAVNLMGSPGSGKTALLESTARGLDRSVRIGAVSGDLATQRDADRLCAAGIPTTAITTGTACHLDAAMVHHALHDSSCSRLNYFFIENVGNLVCPAIYDLGQAANAVVLSVTEGVDKPLKYPVMFKNADLVVVTKIDLLPHLPDVDLASLRENLARVMPEPRNIAVSALTGEGIEHWLQWLGERRAAAGFPELQAHCGFASIAHTEEEDEHVQGLD